ncbi:MAG TPA: DNA polymerase III subunit beta, partial [Rugosimonospora sp.]|nr:DNA polymerase III subunit beta [Rugosimonospora sp.]
MKFSVDRVAFADAVGWAARSLPVRTPTPVLAGVLLRVDQGALRVSSFDYEVSSEAAVEVAADASGAALVSGRLLAEITRALPAKPVSVTGTERGLELVCGSGRFTLPSMPVEDYPVLPELPPTIGTVPATDLATAVSRVALAAGRDDTLPILTGVLVEFDGEQITLLATDRYRLGLAELDWRPVRPDARLTALVPARTLADAAKAMGGHGGDVTVALTPGEDEGMLGLAGGAYQLTTRLLAGAYPKVRSILPTTSVAQLRAATRDLTEVVRRIALVAERTAPLRLGLTADGLLVEAGTRDQAEASEEMAAVVTGDPLTVSLNPQYLLDGLGAMNAPRVLLSFVGPARPVLIQPADDDGEIIPGYRYVAMS